MNQRGDKGTGDRDPRAASGGPKRQRWEPPRIVDFGSIRHLVRKGTGDLNEGVGGGSGQKVRSH